MPWNEPGSSNNGDKDPWTGKPKQSGPPDLEAALRQFKKKLQAYLGNKKPGNGPGKDNSDQPPFQFGRNRIIAVIALLIIAWIAWGFFIVDASEKAVVLRFGKYAETVGPGLHWILRGVESQQTINQHISNYAYEAEMLTKDGNIVSVAVTVQYYINNPRDYLFSVVDAEESLAQATASALRQVIGQNDLDVILTSKREQIQQQVQAQITNILSKYQTGLIITDAPIQSARAPDEVKEAFDDTIKAQEDQQRFENQALSYTMTVVPLATGQAQRLAAEAKAYQQQVVLHAQAEVAPFLALLPEYQQAPAVTRQRIYIETLQAVFADTNKVLVDTTGNNMFYLPLDKLIPPPAKALTAVSPAVSAAASAPTTNTNTDNTDSDRSGGGY